mmetsp:Transcript_1721/g.2575  ORF Transcript_1721/g.2575 Transcript_1721/m.2575 type:complete len:96 (-) Transcript_1721:1023-1310(-)
MVGRNAFVLMEGDSVSCCCRVMTRVAFAAADVVVVGGGGDVAAEEEDHADYNMNYQEGEIDGHKWAIYEDVNQGEVDPYTAAADCHKPNAAIAAT